MASVWERIIRGLGAVTVVIFLVVTLTPASNAVGRYMAVTSNKLQPADAIVVLGAGMDGGVLNQESMRRLLTGIELFNKGMAPIIVVSGPTRPDSPGITESAVRAKLAELMGIPPGAILKEEAANTTREEALRISRTLHDRKAAKILLVTESLHMRRSKALFERAGLDVQPAVSADYPALLGSPGARLSLAIRIAHESGALLYYRLAGYI